MSRSPRWADLRNRAWLEFAHGTGARVGELIALQREVLDLANRAAKVIGKGGKERSVLFGAKAADGPTPELPEEVTA